MEKNLTAILEEIKLKSPSIYEELKALILSNAKGLNIQTADEEHPPVPPIHP
jgi:hypothetical protein